MLDIDGVRLTQSLAIVEYLAEKSPDIGLLPADAAGPRQGAGPVLRNRHGDPPDLQSARRSTRRGVRRGSRATRARSWMRNFIADGLAAFEVMLDDPSTGTSAMATGRAWPTSASCRKLYNAHRWNVDMTPYPRIRAIYAACESSTPSTGVSAKRALVRQEPESHGRSES